MYVTLQGSVLCYSGVDGRHLVLVSLDIQGLAIIENVAIDFTNGFNVITGETGAGKSVLIKAFNLLLGEKANQDLIRHQCSCAVVSGVFKVNYDLKRSQHLEEKLHEAGIFVEKDFAKAGLVELIIRRKISDSGRSQAWVNDTPVTLTTLKKITALLVDVFAQHEHHSLLNPSLHTDFVDQFIKDPKDLFLYKQAYQKSLTTLRDLQLSVEKYKKMLSDHDYLSFRHQELNHFQPSVEDYQSLLDLSKHANNLEKNQTRFETVLSLLDGGEDSVGEGLISQLWKLSKVLSTDDGLASHSGKLATCCEVLEELSFDVRKKSEQFDFDPKSLEEAEERLADYQDYFRKFHVQDCSELLAKLADFEKDLDEFTNAKSNLDVILSQLRDQTNLLANLDRKISKQRLRASKALCDFVDGQLDELAMSQATVTVGWKKLSKAFNPGFALTDLDNLDLDMDRLAGIVEFFVEHGPTGSAMAEFMLQSNPGEPAKPLSKIASGGEISRIMLAMKQVLATGVGACILVFDEIDTGISGRVANIVGNKLSQLSKEFQVVCISHLPQVAAYAHRHYRAIKEIGKRTSTKFIKLSEKERAEEIARLLSGDKVTTSSMNNAKSILREAREAHAKQ